jgi:hypothetical protein
MPFILVDCSLCVNEVILADSSATASSNAICFKVLSEAGTSVGLDRYGEMSAMLDVRRDVDRGDTTVFVGELGTWVKESDVRREGDCGCLTATPLKGWVESGWKSCDNDKGGWEGGVTTVESGVNVAARKLGEDGGKGFGAEVDQSV